MCVYVCMYVCMYMYVCVYIYIYIYVHIIIYRRLGGESNREIGFVSCVRACVRASEAA